MEEANKKKRKSKEKPDIIEYSFGQDYVDDANKIKHPANITGTRKNLEKIRLALDPHFFKKITLAGSPRKSEREKTLGEMTEKNMEG